MGSCDLILLAAGFSRRFGANKLLSPWKGMPLYRWTLDKLVTVCAPHPEWRILVVTQYPEIQEACQGFGICCLHNCRAAEGISSSIRLALSQARGDAVAFFVADQPELSLETVRGFLDGYFASGKGLGCVSGDGRLGNPCVFSRMYFPELLALQGDQGGKAVIRRHKADLFRYEIRDPAGLEDIDEPR